MPCHNPRDGDMPNLAFYITKLHGLMTFTR